MSAQKKYKVEIQKHWNGTMFYTIEASNRDEADEIALKMAEDADDNDFDAEVDYEVAGVSKIVKDKDVEADNADDDDEDDDDEDDDDETCEYCGEGTDDEGECGPCANCKQALCLHSISCGCDAKKHTCDSCAVALARIEGAEDESKIDVDNDPCPFCDHTAYWADGDWDDIAEHHEPDCEWVTTHGKPDRR